MRRFPDWREALPSHQPAPPPPTPPKERPREVLHPVADREEWLERARIWNARPRELNASLDCSPGVIPFGFAGGHNSGQAIRDEREWRKARERTIQSRREHERRMAEPWDQGEWCDPDLSRLPVDRSLVRPSEPIARPEPPPRPRAERPPECWPERWCEDDAREWCDADRTAWCLDEGGGWEWANEDHHAGWSDDEGAGWCVDEAEGWTEDEGYGFAWPGALLTEWAWCDDEP